MRLELDIGGKLIGCCQKLPVFDLFDIDSERIVIGHIQKYSIDLGRREELQGSTRCRLRRYAPKLDGVCAMLAQQEEQ